jgi:hypothetical protein
MLLYDLADDHPSFDEHQQHEASENTPGKFKEQLCQKLLFNGAKLKN